ncbi:hypothetical protein ACFVW1_11685 [Streptomyces olivochromogenes]
MRNERHDERLSDEDLKRVEEAVAQVQIKGERYTAQQQKTINR